jgi:hypothetical protein
VTQRCARWIDFGDDFATGCEQVGAALQRPHRVAADADVAVGEQDLIPAPLRLQRRGEVAADGSSPRGPSRRCFQWAPASDGPSQNVSSDSE